MNPYFSAIEVDGRKNNLHLHGVYQATYIRMSLTCLSALRHAPFSPGSNDHGILDKYPIGIMEIVDKACQHIPFTRLTFRNPTCKY